MSWWTLLPPAASLAGTLLSRPKKKDYIYDTGYMDKYINNLRGQRLDAQISHMVMQPALRAIGQQGARFSRQTDYYTARRKPGGGVEAQMRLSGSRQTLEAIGIAGEKAFFAQYKENRRIGDLIGRIEMEKGRIEAIGKREYAQARTQWGKEIVTGGLTLAATAGASIAKTRKADIGILDKAKSLDLIDDATTLKEWKQMGANQGFENMSMFVNQLARDQGVEQALDVFDPRNIQSVEGIKEDARSGKITAVEAQSRLKKKIELEQELAEYELFDPADEEDLTRDDIILAREKGYISSKKAKEVIDVIRTKAELDKYVTKYYEERVALKENREAMPENITGRYGMIEKMDIPAKFKAQLYEEEYKFSGKFMTSYQRSVIENYLDPNVTPEKLREFAKKKYTTFEEAKWVIGLAYDKEKRLNEGKPGEAEKEKVNKGIALVQIARSRFLITQKKHANKPGVIELAGFLNIGSYADIANLGRNLPRVQKLVAEVAEYADIPVTLTAYAGTYETVFTKDEILDFMDKNDEQKIEIVKQKWQDDFMDSIYKTLGAVDFPGMGGFEAELGISPIWRVGPGAFENKVQLKESIPDDFDLSIWE